jgi:adenosylmethionine-8-amino-7-oxononanoate aminotransferase
MQNEGGSQNVVCWNAMFGGCAVHGHGKEALKQFYRGQLDDVTFVCLLSVCSHAGLVDDGMHC